MKTKTSKFKDKSPSADGGGFRYKHRDKSNVARRSTQSGGGFDPFLIDGVPFFKAKEGSNRIRPLPPTWDGAEHFGMDVWMHGNIGPDNLQYICHEKHGKGHCPICAERLRAEKEGDTETAGNLRARKKVGMFVIDRSDTAAGPKFWCAPWKCDRDISAACIDPESGDIFETDNPEEGYDVLFTRAGSGLRTEYTAFKLSRNKTPLSESPKEMRRWLQWAVEHPIPDCLRFYDPERIEAVLSGGATKSEEDESKDDAPETRKSRHDAPPAKKLKKKFKSKDGGEVKKAKKKKPPVEDDGDAPF